MHSSAAWPSPPQARSARCSPPHPPLPCFAVRLRVAARPWRGERAVLLPSSLASCNHHRRVSCCCSITVGRALASAARATSCKLADVLTAAAGPAVAAVLHHCSSCSHCTGVYGSGSRGWSKCLRSSGVVGSSQYTLQHRAQLQSWAPAAGLQRWSWSRYRSSPAKRA